MSSPFPGMDPYIEVRKLWEDFHHHLIEAIYWTIAPALPKGYTASTGVRSYVVLMDAEGKKETLAKPDVTVTEPAARKKSRQKKGRGAVVAELGREAESVPMCAFVSQEFKEAFVEIHAEDEENRYLVTCIEVLSPSNKRRGTRGWRKYERKRQALLLGRASFVEIDLLRGGHRMPMLDPWPDSPYTLLVCRQLFAPHPRVWPAHFQSRLPIIPVPLSSPDPDLTLDLQPLIGDIYALGRYEELIDYSRPLTPALSEGEAAWVRDCLKHRSPRSNRKYT